MADIEKAFVYLQDNIPLWCTNVDDIERKIVAMQRELARVPVSMSRPLKLKTGSVESLRGLDVIHENPPPAQDLTSRKRKTPSVSSGQASGPCKMRSRTMIVVHYDGQIQTAFEQLVRAIGTGRNMLRKAKMAAKMEAMAALADFSDDDDDDENSVLSKISYRHRGLPSMRSRSTMMQTPAGSTPVDRFDSADKALEQAQALCEKAAHQSLREGDCRKELDGVTDYFEQTLQVAKTEVARHAERKANEQEEAANQIPTPDTLTPSPIKDLEKELIPSFIPAVVSIDSTTKAVDIEVDDEGDDDTSFVMPPIRLTSRV